MSLLQELQQANGRAPTPVRVLERETVNVILCTLTGKRVMLRVHPMDEVQVVKQLIHEKEGGSCATALG